MLGRLTQKAPCNGPYRSTLRLLRDVLDRRFTVDASEEQSGQQSRSALFDRRFRLPGDALQIGARQRFEAGEVCRCTLGPPDALQQQMVKAERQVERGI